MHVIALFFEDFTYNHCQRKHFSHQLRLASNPIHLKAGDFKYCLVSRSTIKERQKNPKVKHLVPEAVNCWEVNVSASFL